MKQLKSKVSNFISNLRPLAIAAACALVLLVNVTPAFALGGSSSSLDKGLEQLDGVQQKSEAVISKEGKNSTRNVLKNSKEGLNGVQGAANKNDMLSPDDVSVDTVESTIEEALEEIK